MTAARMFAPFEYARTIPDRDRDEWVRLEIESNPLPICTRPQVLRQARRT